MRGRHAGAAKRTAATRNALRRACDNCIRRRHREICGRSAHPRRRRRDATRSRCATPSRSTPPIRDAVPAKNSAMNASAKTDGIEDLRATIGLIGRDAHLRHDLKQALVDRLDVALHRLGAVDLLGEVVRCGRQRLEGEIRVDRLCPVTRETGEVMHLARFARLDDEPHRGAQALANEMVVHRRPWRAALGSGCGLARRRRSDRTMML